jgi:hypothetical protein
MRKEHQLASFAFDECFYVWFLGKKIMKIQGAK